VKRPVDSTADFERATASQGLDRYELRMYVAGATGSSSQAIRNVRSICDEWLKGRYQLEVVDVYQQPELARDDQILAVPTLIKRVPPPLRRLIGDLSNRERVLLGLGLTPEAKNDAKEAHPRRRRPQR
jgi:circadian clock protein KaiB